MKPISPTSIKKVLIRAVNWIGDAVMTTPAIGVVREYFPAAEITVLANPLVSQIFVSHDWVDRVMTFDRNGLHSGVVGRIRLATELRRERFDLAIILPNSLDSALVPWLAGIPVRLGKTGDARTLLLNRRFPKELQPRGIHQTQNYLAMLRYFGITGLEKPQLLNTTESEDRDIAVQLSVAGITQDDFVLGINPGATYGSAKRWYPERFAAVARDTAANIGARIVITGGPGETAIAADIDRELAGNCINLAGKTSVRQLMALLKRCNFLVTNDSGPMHLAAAFNVPLVAIFGSTDHTTTFPLSDRAVVVRESVSCAPCMKRECPVDHICMLAVTVERVEEAVMQLYTKVYR